MHRFKLPLFALLLSCSAPSFAMEPAPLLIEPATLANLVSDSPQPTETLVVLDVRSAEAYAEGHIAGAVHVDGKQWKSTFGDGDNAEAWTELIGKLLPSSRATVVVVDSKVSPSAARTWWILKYWGVDDVRILDGGMQAWLAEGGTLSTDTPAAVEASTFKAVAQPERYANFQQVQAIALGKGSPVCLIDTRTDKENSDGFIPTARHLNWEELVDADTGKLLPVDQLRQLLAGVEFDPAKPAVTYCGGGGRAAVMAFAIELATGKPAANYHGSWGDWTEHHGLNDLDAAEYGFGLPASTTPEQCPEEGPK